MGEKTAGVGHFTIPTAPAAGTSCTSGAANVFTTTYVQLIASTGAALFITGIYVEQAAVAAGTYIAVQLAVGGAGSETIIGQHFVAPVTGSTVARCYKPIYPYIPVANAARISCKTADSVGALASLITLECIAQSNVVDDGVAVGTVTTLTNLPAITANWLTAAGINAGALNGKGDWMVSYTQPTGFLAATFPASVASPTNITAGVITTVTNLTNAPTAGDFTAPMKTSLNAATPASVTGAVGSVTGAVGSVTAAVTLPSIPNNWITAAGINAAALNGKGDWLLSSGYTAPLTAATTRAALGLASANLDTQLAAIDADVLTRLATAGYTIPPTTAAIADKLLGRNLAGGADGTRTMADAMRALRNKTSLAAGVLTVYAEDDTTPAWTAAVTQAVRDPITSVDPA